MELEEHYTNRSGWLRAAVLGANDGILSTTSLANLFKSILFFLIILASITGSAQSSKSVSLFNGKNFQGWQGDTLKTWHIQDGAIVAGALSEFAPQNDFLVTKATYRNFILRLKVKLTGSEGFVNAGVQFHSQRSVSPPNEMIGYQADVGPKYWGALYDESRRDKILASPDSNLIASVVKPEQWNELKIWSENGHIRIFINGKQTINYIESDNKIPQTGKIGLQIHGAGKTLVQYKEIFIQPLP